MMKDIFGNYFNKAGSLVDKSGSILEKKPKKGAGDSKSKSFTGAAKNELFHNENISYIDKGTKLGLSKKHLKILKECATQSTAKELRSILDFTNASKFKKNYLDILIESGYMAPIDPKFILKKEKIAKRDFDGNLILNASGKITYIDKMSESGEVITKRCLAPNPQQKYKLTGKFVKNKI